MYSRKIDPNLQTVTIFVMGTAVWMAMLTGFYSHFIRHSDFEIDNNYKLYLVGTVFFFMIFYNYYFFVSDRYLKIYDQFKIYSKENKNRKRDLVLSFTFIFIPVPIIALYATLMHFDVIR